MFTRNGFSFTGLDRVQREMGRVFTNVFDNLERAPERTLPAINMWETDDALLAEAEVPGLTMEQIEVFVMNDELTLKGRRSAPQTENGTFHRRERRAGEFTRVVTLPAPVNADAVEATLRDGVLTIKLPKAAEARARRIEVKGV